MKKLLLAFTLLLPFVYLLYMLFVHEVEDPIKYIYTITGSTALILLYITTTISMVKKAVNLLTYRRMVGLFSFFYAFLHMLNFVILDMELDFMEVLEETLEKPFIYLGMSAFLILLFMAITSLKVLFSKFYKYHKVIYLALLLASIHFAMAQKALNINQWGYIFIMVVIGVFKFLQRTKLAKI
jgi:methionine sulfoxide reductase heme-binding subunit